MARRVCQVLDSSSSGQSHLHGKRRELGGGSLHSSPRMPLPGFDATPGRSFLFEQVANLIGT